MGTQAFLPQRGTATRSSIFGPGLFTVVAKHSWMDQMLLGREAGLGPGDIALHRDVSPSIFDWDLALPQKGIIAAPTFRPMSIVAKRLESRWMDQDATW